MLIDRDYFTGLINVANRDKPEIAENLDFFINHYEEKFMTAALGKSFYDLFLSGLVDDPIDQRWRDLLYGASYTKDDRTYQWPGFVGKIKLVISMKAQSFDITVDGGDTFDPTDSADTATIPTAPIDFTDTDFIFIKVVDGIEQPLIIDVDYIINGTDIELQNDVTFLTGEIYRYKATESKPIQTAVQDKKSCIANYVYFYWTNDLITQTTTMGEVSPKMENSNRESPGHKVVTAWRKMRDDLLRLKEFLEINASVYPEWEFIARDWRQFNTVNEFGI